MPVYIVLLGPPGAGKGTQAQLVSKRLGLPHVSSGELFRENLKAQTEVGKLAQTFINRGELVPDDVTINMVAERLTRLDCANGALLDGFPRTIVQAEKLAEKAAGMGGKVDCVPYISVPTEELIRRLGGRWTCRAQGHVYHQQFSPPATHGICDVDSSELYQRDDDRPETVKNRIRVYFEQTEPLIEYYRQKNLLVEIDGRLSIEQVTEKLLVEIRKVL